MAPIQLDSRLPHDTQVAEAVIELLSRVGASGLADAADPGPPMMFGASTQALLSTALAHLIEHDRRERMSLTTLAPGDVAGATARVAALLERWTSTRARDLLVARHEISVESTRRPVLAGFVADWRMALIQNAVVLATRVGSRDPEDHALALTTWMDGVLWNAVLHPDLPGPGGPESRRLIRRQVEAR